MIVLINKYIVKQKGIINNIDTNIDTNISGYKRTYFNEIYDKII